MNIFEVATQIKEGDNYRLKGDEVWTKYNPDVFFGSLCWDDIARSEFEIKKKEEGPITAKEYLNFNVDRFKNFTSSGKNYIRMAFESGEENGVLKTELKYKDLVEGLDDAVHGRRPELNTHYRYYVKELVKLIRK